MAKLILRNDGVGKEFDLEKSGSLTVGRAPDCDIPITDSQASRRHCSVVRLQAGYEVADLGSTNGTLVNSTLVKRQKLKHGDVIRIGQVEIAFDDPSSAGGTAEPAVGYLVYAKGDKKGQRVELTAQRTTIGRKATNTIVIEDAVSSSYHCEIVRGLNGYAIRDLGSTNGTLVNSEMVTEAQLSHGARIRIGNTRFVFQDPAMAEIDLELAGAEDEDEWGMMRDIDLAAVRKRNPATIAYALLFVAIVGAGGYFLSMEKPPTLQEDSGPQGNLHADWSFEAATPFWRGEPDPGVTISTSMQVKGGGTRSIEIRTSVPVAEAFFEARIPVERAVYRVKGLVAARGAKARLGLLWLGTGLRRWATAPAVQSPGMTPVDVALSAPPWATGVLLGVRIDGDGAVFLDDVSLVKEAGQPLVQQATIGEFRVDVTDGSAIELFYSGAPILVNGRLMGPGGSDAAAGAIKAEKQDDEHVLITVEGASGERAGVMLDEVENFLRDGFRAFTPNSKEKPFHPSFPDEDVLALKDVSKLLLGPTGTRSFAALAGSDGKMLDAEARADGETRALVLLGPVADGKVAFRLKLDLTGENQLARERIAEALTLHSQRRWGEFLVAAERALAEFPFANPTSRTQLNKLIGQVNEEYEKRRSEIDRLLEEYRAFKDQEDLDQAGVLLGELEQLFQLKEGEGTRGQHLADTKAEVKTLDLAARQARESKAAEHTDIQAKLVDIPDGREFSATLQFYYIAAFLPNSKAAANARTEYLRLAAKYPQIPEVLDKLGFKKVPK